MPDIVTISDSTLSAQVSALGAELLRLQDHDGLDLLWDGDPAFWTGRSPLLFPILSAVTGPPAPALPAPRRLPGARRGLRAARGGWRRARRHGDSIHSSSASTSPTRSKVGRCA